MIKITNKFQNITGYWGPVDTTTTFCEPHYSIWQYFAEFYNAWSSMIYVLVGMYLLRATTKKGCCHYRSQTAYACYWLIIIGIGSFLFHATMRYSMQLLDELPMVGFVCQIVYGKATSKHHDGIIAKYSKLIQFAIITQAIGISIIYLYLDLYEFFVHGFTIMVVNEIMLGYFSSRAESPWLWYKQIAYFRSVLFIIVGKIAWEMENQLCQKFPSIWPMHTLWHFLSAYSAYHSTLHLYFSLRNDDEATIPDLISFPKKQQQQQTKKEHNNNNKNNNDSHHNKKLD